MTRLEAEFVRREAPPSYGQLIAQGLIPPVEDFPVYSASQVSLHKYEYGVPQGPGFFTTGSQRAPKSRRPRGKLGVGCLEVGKVHSWVQGALISFWSGTGWGYAAGCS